MKEVIALLGSRVKVRANITHAGRLDLEEDGHHSPHQKQRSTLVARQRLQLSEAPFSTTDEEVRQLLQLPEHVVLGTGLPVQVEMQGHTICSSLGRMLFCRSLKFALCKRTHRHTNTHL